MASYLFTATGSVYGVKSRYQPVSEMISLKVVCHYDTHLSRTFEVKYKFVVSFYLSVVICLSLMCYYSLS